MSAGAETELLRSVRTAQVARAILKDAVAEERRATMDMIRRAIAQGWTWERIGFTLGISGTGARRFYNRNRALLDAD